MDPYGCGPILRENHRDFSDFDYGNAHAEDFTRKFE